MRRSTDTVKWMAGLGVPFEVAGARWPVGKRTAAGELSALFAFSCIGRHWHAAARNTDRELAALYATYPTIGGQYADYIGHSLQAYRNGDRQHALMSSQAKALTDQQIADLAAYFGTRDSGLVTLHGAHD